MTFAQDIADDYLQFEETQTVTLRPLTGDPVSVAGVATFPLSFKQLGMIGGLAPSDESISFSLAKAACGGVEPVNESQIVDENGVVWVVLTKELKTLGTRWLCICVKAKEQISCPFQPVDLADDGSSNGILRLTWTNRNRFDEGLAGEVEVSTTADFLSSNIYQVPTISGAAVTFSQSSPGNRYVRVRHSNAIGNSPWSSVSLVNAGTVLAVSSANSVSVVENTTFVQTAAATGGVSPYNFGIFGGDDGGKFNVSAGTTISFDVAPDFENPTDANLDNVYEFLLRATDDEGNTSDRLVSVTVTDEVD